MEEEELEERRRLWFGHGCPHYALYGDDGEMLCGSCRRDFKRSPLETLRKTEEKADQNKASS
jgi:hypothetical protein